MILDNLIEKKDLDTYIEARIGFLKNEIKKIKDYPEKKRDIIAYGFDKRMLELKFLRKILHGNKKPPLKKYAVDNWNLTKWKKNSPLRIR